MEVGQLATAGLPLPGITIGDPNYQCRGSCDGNKTMLGCGGDRAWDLYSVVTPCVLFQDCDNYDVAIRDGDDARLL